MIYSVTAKDFTLKSPSRQLVLKGARPDRQYLLLCVASWCNYCKRLNSAIRALDDDLRGRFVFLEAQETNPSTRSLLTELNVQGYPSIFFIDNEGVVDRTGYHGDRTAQGIKETLLLRGAL